jgi:uncharacterized protein YndB with AHSA1/START domain
MSETQTLNYEKLINAPLKQVYQAFTSSVALEHWFSDYAEVVPSENGRFYAFWNAGHYASGLFKEVTKYESLIFSWRGRGESKETLVTIKFKQHDDQTIISLLHSGLGISENWRESVKAIDEGWKYALENLKAVMETGLDKRLYDQPMLGIYPNQLIDEEMAEKLGLPVASGVEIGGVVEGLGAEAAGLQAEDILFSIGDQNLRTFADFSAAVAGQKAGDVVDVVFFRDGIKRTAKMTLSSRPFPEVPENAERLSEQVDEIYNQTNNEIQAVFMGVKEADASSRPEPCEWSAKETLAHLLYTERWLHLAISCAVADQRAGGFANQIELIKAMADGYNTQELLEAFVLSCKTTVRSLAALPEDFVADKRKFVRLASTIGQGFAIHAQGHLQQIKDALAAAKK